MIVYKMQNLQMKEGSNQKLQENKPVLELKNTKEKVYQKMWIKLFSFYLASHCALLYREERTNENNKELKN